MDVDTIRALYGYNQWANERMLAVAEKIPAEGLRERFGTSFDSIHGTLAHVLAAETVWLSRWRGISPPRLLNADDFASLAAIRTRWTEHQRDLQAFLDELTPEKFAASLSYTNTAGKAFRYPLWQMMLHVVNHGTHHRSELADMLTRAGQAPPPMDLIVYFGERASAIE
jgi:uncharacterized damage-inducible protein DinB